jgi:hypothetical protein
MDLEEYHRKPGCVVSEEQKLAYTGMYLLKLMDLKLEDGGIVVPLLLPSELTPLDDALQTLLYEDRIAMNRRKERYDITKKGHAYLSSLIHEAEAMIDEFADAELEDTVRVLEARNLDVFRARFLWGWYEGEFDDLVLFQQRRGAVPVESLWAFYLMSDEFYNELAKDF